MDAPITDAPVEQEEPKTEAQEMTEVINQINTEPEVVAEAKPKKKTSRSKPEAKAQAVTDIQASSSSSTELPPEQHEPAQPPADAPSSMLHPGAAVRSAVVCEFCGKSMTAKSFKYSHVFTCKSKPKEEPKTDSALVAEVNKREELLYQAMCNRMASAREAKARHKEERMNKLFANAVYVVFSFFFIYVHNDEEDR